MKATKLLAIAVVLLVLAAGCKKDDDGNTNFNTNCTIPFLKVGNMWEYDEDNFFNSYTRTVEIISEDNGVFELKHTISTGGSYTEYWVIDCPYMKSYAVGEDPSDARIIYLKDAMVGDTWTNPSTSNPGETLTYTVTAVNQSIGATAGTFTTTQYAVTFSNASNTQYNYWSDTNGQVYQEGFLALDLISKNF